MHDGWPSAADAFFPDHEGVRRDTALDDQLSQTIGRRDVDDIPVARVGVECEEYAGGGDVGADHLHHDDAEAAFHRVHVALELIADGALCERGCAALTPAIDDALFAPNVQV